MRGSSCVTWLSISDEVLPSLEASSLRACSVPLPSIADEQHNGLDGCEGFFPSLILAGTGDGNTWRRGEFLKLVA